MRVDRERQIAKAAAIAGLLVPAIDPETRAATIAAQVAPAIAAAIAAELAEIRTGRAAHDRRERDVMDACHDVGAALDRLEQTKFTSGEPAARQLLERMAVKLRRAMAKRDAHGPR